ncbi:MAG: HD family phosphohydrolase [Spirochaetaceae bacterium]
MKTKQNNSSLIPFGKVKKLWDKKLRLIILLIAGTFAVNTLLLVFTTQFHFSGYARALESFEQGEVADSRLTAGNSLTYVDKEETERLIEQRQSEVPPVYSIDSETIYTKLSQFEQFGTFLSHNSSLLSAEELLRQVRLQFSLDISEELSSTLPYVEDLEKIGDLVPLAETLLRTQLEQGVFEEKPTALLSLTDLIELRKWEDGEKVGILLPTDELRTEERAMEEVKERFEKYSLSKQERTILTGIIRMFLSPTAYYDDPLTREKKTEVKENIPPVTKTIQEGEVLIEEGEIVSEQDMKKIEAIQSSRPAPNYKESFAILLYIAFIFILGFILVEPLLQKTERTLQHTIILLASSIIFSLNIFFVVRFAIVPVSYPVSLGILTAFLSMMISILMTERIGIIASLLFSLGLFAVPAIDIYAFLFSFFAGVTGIYAIVNAEKRIDLVSGTLKLTGVVILILLVIGLLQREDLSWMVNAGGLGIVYSLVTGGLTLALLPALEHVLNAPTVFRLRELSDTNTPIFRRMITAAPGTYSHSMSVAHLAESACRDLGANHLLARVGAYYHDIGKMEQPDYFIENQQDRNRHDEISPNLSVAVIKSHVKMGKEKAKELKLPPEIVEIVADHHGNDVISYFYSQALKKSEKNVSPEEFSYNGVPPRSKESAIVMLADAIEAQSRTIKKPTVKKFEKMVWDSIMRKVTNRQLSRSELSFQDIETIKNSFVQILTGYFHNRIEYPETKETKENKEAEE